MSAFRYAAILLAAAALSAQSAPPPRRGESDNPSARAAWFMRFRQSLDGESPAQHRLEALRQAQAMPTLHRPRLAAAPQPGAAASGASPAVPSPELGGDWTELGPRPETTSQYGTVSGRVTALAVDLGKDPSGNTIYVGAADGGVWYSANALSASPTFTQIGDNLPSLAVGAIALDDSTTPTTIYVGSGEGNNSGDSYYGIGIEKSTDGGKTWTLGNGPADFFGSGIEKLIVDAT